MEDSAYDIAMKFVLDGGGTIWAESTLTKDGDDPLMKDFDPVTDLSDYSNFFEVTTFDFSMNNEADDGDAGKKNGGAAAGGRAGVAARLGPSAHSGSAGLLFTGSAGRPPQAAAGAAPEGGSSDPFHRWRSATEKEAMAMSFQLSFDSFKFTRIVDGASPAFFQNCARQVTFESAALIKRVSLGAIGGVQRPALAFMRFDFKSVMLKKVEWTDGDLVTENCEFVCDWLSFQYRQQNSDGSLKPVAHMATWDRKRDSQRKKQDRNNG